MSQQLTEREALDLIRATATRSVPNCINLQTIDRILADVPAALSAGSLPVGWEAAEMPDEPMAFDAELVEFAIDELRKSKPSLALAVQAMKHRYEFDLLAEAARLRAGVTLSAGAALPVGGNLLAQLQREAARCVNDEQWEEIRYSLDVDAAAEQGRAMLATEVLAALPGSGSQADSQPGSWISVDERLPEAENYIQPKVLLLYKEGQQSVGTIEAHWLTGKAQAYPENVWLNDYTPICWQPLPAAPTTPANDGKESGHE